MEHALSRLILAKYEVRIDFSYFIHGRRSIVTIMYDCLVLYNAKMGRERLVEFMSASSTHTVCVWVVSGVNVKTAGAFILNVKLCECALSRIRLCLLYPRSTLLLLISL